MKSYLLSALVLTLVAAAVTISNNQRGYSPLDKASAESGAKQSAQSVTVPSDLNKRPLKLPLVDPNIVVSKAKRRLTLYAGGEAVRIYPVGLGSSPKEDKARQGDGRTPEGRFYVCVKNPNSNYYLSLGLSYPNKEHAQRGLRSRIITRAQYDQITKALEAKARPPWNTPLGGEIFIHGAGAKSDWTLGCVALENDDMKELFGAIPRGAPVQIEP
jgi:lipoprotein-anchoring transpeptidase ErfK/SrfK